MDPQSVNHTSRNFQLLVFCSKSLYFSGKTAHALFLTKNISAGWQAIPFWDLFLRATYFIFGPKIHCQSVQKICHFWTFCSRKICYFWTQNTLPICSKQIFICHKVGLESTKRVLLEKYFRRDSTDNGLISNKMTNICFFMFGWKTNQWNPASEWNDFVSQASKKVLLWLQTLYLSRPGL